MTQSSNAKAIDSIELQINYYEKQLQLLNLRKTLCQKAEKQINKANNKNTDSDYCDVSINEHVDKTTDIQLDLLKNLEESYKLIEELNRIDNPEISPKVSELHNLNSQLNLMFHKLSISMEEVLRENVLLREKYKVDDSKTATTIGNKSDEFKKNHEISEQRDSDDSSPNEEIQELPPLEMPSFNLDVLDDK